MHAPFARTASVALFLIGSRHSLPKPAAPDPVQHMDNRDLEGLAEMGHGLPLHDGRHHSFELRSFSMALSSIASANSFISLAFSSVRSFSPRASDTSRLPYLPFHLKKLGV